MRIDWTNGIWHVWEIETGALLGKARHIIIRTQCELVNTDGDRHGWLIVAGRINKVSADRIIIEEQNDG